MSIIFQKFLFYKFNHDSKKTILETLTNLNNYKTYFYANIQEDKNKLDNFSNIKQKKEELKNENFNKKVEFFRDDFLNTFEILDTKINSYKEKILENNSLFKHDYNELKELLKEYFYFISKNDDINNINDFLQYFENYILSIHDTDENIETTSDILKIKLKQYIEKTKKIKKNFQKDYLYLIKEKLKEDILNSDDNIDLSISKSKIFVLVYGDEILVSYPSTLYNRLTEKNFLKKKKKIKRIESIKKFQFKVYPDVREKVDEHTILKRKRLKKRKKLTRREILACNNDLTRTKLKPTLKFLKIKNTNKNRRNYILLNENNTLGAITLGFLSKKDAYIYKKEIMMKRLASTRRTRVVIKKGRLTRLRKYSKVHFRLKNFIQLKTTKISNVKDEIKTFQDFKGNKINNTLIIIPQFLNSDFKVPKKGTTINFPEQMLSKNGFIGNPIYKTKPISKKVYKSKIDNKFNVLYTKRNSNFKTIFITINKKTYKNLEKKYKSYLILYKEEKNFVDTIQNIKKEWTSIVTKQINSLQKKIKENSNSILNLKKILNFILENKQETNFLPKISNFIDKISK
jgi:hypothetical protein